GLRPVAAVPGRRRPRVRSLRGVGALRHRPGELAVQRRADPRGPAARRHPGRGGAFLPRRPALLGPGARGRPAGDRLERGLSGRGGGAVSYSALAVTAVVLVLVV